LFEELVDLLMQVSGGGKRRLGTGLHCGLMRF